jgi:mRNA interferase RelE/StbE
MYDIVYHEKVVDDLRQIAPTVQKTLKKAIDEKLVASPELFGKPLQFSLKNVRSMRVGDYRVIFQMSQNTVRVVMIGHRSTVYKKAEKRII